MTYDMPILPIPPSAPYPNNVVQHFSGHQVIDGHKLLDFMQAVHGNLAALNEHVRFLEERTDKHDKLTDWIAKYHPDVLTSYEASEEVRRRIEESVSAPKP